MATVPTSAEDIEPMAPDPINSIAAKMEKDMADKLKTLLGTVPKKGEEAAAALQPEPASPPAVAQAAAVSPAPGVTPPAPSPAPEEEIPEHERPPAGAAKATKEDWMRFRALKNSEVVAERKEKERLAAELEAIKKASPDNENQVQVEEFERIKKANAELESLVERVALENSPRFQNHYTGQINKEWTFIKKIAGSHAEEVVKLLENGRSTEDRARWREIKEELGPDGDMIAESFSKIRKLGIERDEQLSNHRENFKLLKQREQSEAAENKQKSQAKRQAIAETVVNLAKSMPEFKPSNGDTEHAKFVGEAESFIRGAILGNMEEQDAARLPVLAMRAQYFEKIRIPKLEAEIATLTKRVQDLTGAAPRVEGRGAAPGKPMPNDKTAMTAADYDPNRGTQEIIDKFNMHMGKK